MNTPFQTAVLGGGIIGMSIALALQQEGIRVAVLERGTVCGGASGGNAGHLATEQIYPVASPEVLKQLPAMLADPLSPLRLDWRYLPQLMPWLMRLLANMRPGRFENICAALRRLNAESWDAWRIFSRQWGLDAWVKTEGSLLVAEKPDSIRILAQHGGKLAQYGVANRLLNQAELHDLAPNLSDTQTGGLFFPDTGHVLDLAAVSARLQTAFAQMGGAVLTDFDVEAIRDDGNVFHIRAQGREVRAENLVLAAGAFSKPWVKKLTGIDVPLDTERGYHLMLPYMQDVLPLPVSSFDRRFIMTPMAGGLRLAGTVEYAGLDAPPNMARAWQLAKLAAPMLSVVLDAEGASPWMGFRPTLPDSLPVIDKTGRLYFAFGHQHLGLTQAPLTAQWVKRLYFGETQGLDLRAYRLNRF